MKKKNILFFDCKETEKNYLTKNTLLKYNFTYIKDELNLSSIKKLSVLQKQVEMLSIFITSKVGEKELKNFPNLKLIITRSTGTNHIDLNYCQSKNIQVKNIEGYGAITVAEYTFALLLSLTRKVLPAAQHQIDKKVDYANFIGTDIHGKTIGLIGYGQIGQQVARLALAFNMKVLAHDPFKEKEIKKSKEIKYAKLDELLKNSDIISLHCPYIPTQNYHMFDKKLFSKMKNGVLIINTARGELIDVFVLYDALKSKKVSGFASDVMEYEVLTQPSKSELSSKDSATKKKILSIMKKNSDVKKLENVIITPHIAFNTQESITRILDEVLKILKK